ncbi:MAG: peptidylprolyl isomerase [Treponema sp.]|jgi:FKBP-type peptidyl-prolyl cis-trans isomerase SlyD|nr:peptidylprolyl isomerase [Treponema sp.]
MNITKNSVVGIGYTLRDTNNQFIDSTPGSNPLVYLHGYENIIPGLERALEGKVEGDNFKITVPAAEAYGNREAELITQVSLDCFEGVPKVEAGMQFEAQTSGGYRLVTVTEVSDNVVTVDGNHPLAGQDLRFDVTVMSVREASADELACGHPHHAHGHDHGDCDSCNGCGGSCCGN